MSTIAKSPKSPQSSPERTTPRRRGRRRVIDGIQAPGPVESIVKGVILLICCAAVVVPFVGVVSTSIATPEQVSQAGGFVLLPKGIDVDAYRMIFAGGVVQVGGGDLVLVIDPA